MKLPNLLVIGAIKAGTTSLYHYLRQHPQIFMSPLKEPNYFWYSGRYEPRSRVRTWEEYLRLFEGARDESVIGEASAQYLHQDQAVERIHESLPGVRLIVSLRNPVDRAYSDYLAKVRGDWERRTFADVCEPGSAYVERGLYYDRARHYLQVFGRRRMHFNIFENFAADPQRNMEKIFRFVGVDDSFVPDMSVVHNRGTYPKSLILNRGVAGFRKILRAMRCYAPTPLRGHALANRLQRLTSTSPPPVPNDLRLRLMAMYRDDIRRLEDLLNVDLAHWLEAPPAERRVL
jgi:hypothetical protein